MLLSKFSSLNFRTNLNIRNGHNSSSLNLRIFCVSLKCVFTDIKKWLLLELQMIVRTSFWRKTCIIGVLAIASSQQASLFSYYDNTKLTSQNFLIFLESQKMLEEFLYAMVKVMFNYNYSTFSFLRLKKNSLGFLHDFAICFHWGSCKVKYGN